MYMWGNLQAYLVYMSEFRHHLLGSNMAHGNCTEIEFKMFCSVLVSLLMFVYLLYIHRDVHAVCLWDDKGPAKIHQALKEDILEFIKQAQAVSSTCLF